MLSSNPLNKIFPKYHLGQNFLIDLNIRNKIISFCGIKPTDTVLEIGPGLGVLTSEILKKAKDVIAIEKDNRLCDYLKNNFGDYKNFTLIHDDVLKYPFERLCKNNIDKIKVIGNLPYNISTPIIEKLLTYKNYFSSIFITLQWEFAKRLAASVNTKDYSSLSCFVQYYCEVNSLIKIKNTCFKPAPKVHSSFIELNIRPKPLFKADDEKLLFSIIRCAFQQRRKTILNSLSTTIEKNKLNNIFTKLNLSPQLRAENLTLKNFLDIANQIGREQWND